MANRFDPPRVIPPAPIVAALVGAGAAVAFAIVPMSLVERVVLDSGITAFVAAAAPPLGFTARLLLVMFGGGGLGGVAWLATLLLLGRANAPIAGDGFILKRPRRDEDDAPILRRADAHPDAPPRAPLRANRDLGTGLPDGPPPPRTAPGPALADPDFDIAIPEGERALPDDLNEPLAAYDAAASQSQAEPECTHAVVKPPVKGDPAETIHALLDRLERVLQRGSVGRAAFPGAMSTATPIAPPAGGFEDTLAALRALAQRSR